MKHIILFVVFMGITIELHAQNEIMDNWKNMTKYISNTSSNTITINTSFVVIIPNNNNTTINTNGFINTFQLQDYSIINRNPSDGIINNPNKNLFKINTITTFKQPNYVKQTYKVTIPKVTRISNY